MGIHQQPCTLNPKDQELTPLSLTLPKLLDKTKLISRFLRIDPQCTVTTSLKAIKHSQVLGYVQSLRLTSNLCMNS